MRRVRKACDGAAVCGVRCVCGVQCVYRCGVCGVCVRCMCDHALYAV